jgi:hypothetical protein
LAKTYLDQLVEYPAKIIKKISEDKFCVALLTNKKASDVTEDDSDDVLDNYIYDYQYVDETTQEAKAFVWVDIEIGSVENLQIKNVRIYITVACHKGYMKLDGVKFTGMIGNRKDNLVRYIDKLLNNVNVAGIGTLKLQSVKTLSPISGFAVREITYEVPDFNIVALE